MGTPDRPAGYRILIVEDEFIIADSIERNLRKRGHEVVGKAISYEDAVALYAENAPELVLIDVRLSGPRTGIDLAGYLNTLETKVPFIYLTSQIDTATLERAKATFPAGYLSKPIQMATLHSTIAVAVHNHQSAEPIATLTLRDGRSSHILDTSSILYLQADHVYVRVHLSDRPSLVLRSSLSELLSQLPAEQFVQIHRSYVVNLQRVTRYEREHLYLSDTELPLSRSRREAVLALL